MKTTVPRVLRRAVGQHVRTFVDLGTATPRFPAHGICYTVKWGNTRHLPPVVQQACDQLRSDIQQVTEGYLPPTILGLHDLLAIEGKGFSSVRRWWLRQWEEKGIISTREDWLAREAKRKEKRTCSAS